jgi:phosphate acetyltransferase
MAQNLYVCGAEPGNGKSAIVLAIMEQLSGCAERAGFFRPVINDTPETDALLRLITSRYALELPLEALYGCTLKTARQLIAAQQYDELLKRILDKYSVLSAQCDFVLCAGTDYSGAANTLEFDFNADVANNLDCPVIPVVRGTDRSTAQTLNASIAFLTSLRERDCSVVAAVVNRVPPDQLSAIKAELERQLAGRTPVYVVPEEPALARPTVADIASAIHATPVYGDPESLTREVSSYKVAAMELPGFLDHIEAGSLIITPGDRSDIILGSMLSYPSSAYPQIAGLLLSGGVQPAAQVKSLIEGLGNTPVPVLSVPTDTFVTAMDASRVQAVLTPDNERRIAAALGVVEKAVDLGELQRLVSATPATRVTPLMFEQQLVQRARSDRRHIVLPEGDEERILRAAEILSLRAVADLTLLGEPQQIRAKIDALGLHLDDITIIDPQHSPLREQFADHYYALRQHKGISRQMAFDTLADVSYFGTMLVQHGLVDGMVSGSVHTTQHTVRPAFEIIRTRRDSALVSSVFFMCLEDRVLVYGDCAINPNPDAEQLADIAITSADTARMFGIEPRVAMLSYSTGDSGKGAAVDKVIEATRIATRRRPDLKLEGPIQYDAAVDASVAKTKLPGSQVAGQATVFVFPDLNTGNNTYKAVQRSADAVAIGPVLQGLNKPVNDLSRGCTVTDIVNTVAITAIQAQTALDEPA